MRSLPGILRGRCGGGCIAAACLLFVTSCGSDAGTSPRASYVLTAPEGLGQAVVVDSVRWSQTAFYMSPSGELEVTGPYEIHFRSTVEERLEMRYDLRFLDKDGFLFGQFIPFGLPVVFGPRQTIVESGEFEIRSAESGLDDVRTMRIAATVRVAEE